MSSPGAPLNPIPDALRWTGRWLGWTAVLSLAAVRAGGGDRSALEAAAMLGVFTLALVLDTHRWLPTQNTVAAYGQVSMVGCLILLARGRASEPVLSFNLLIWFSHLLAARGLIRYLLRPCRGASGYGAGVLVGTTLLAGVSVGLSQTCLGQGPSVGEWLFQTASLVLAVLAASVWLLVKKPVPEIPNPRPAVLWVMLTTGQCCVLALQGRIGGAGFAGMAATAALIGIFVVRRITADSRGFDPTSRCG